jgi:hypothetical protein
VAGICHQAEVVVEALDAVIQLQEAVCPMQAVAVEAGILELVEVLVALMLDREVTVAIPEGMRLEVLAVEALVVPVKIEFRARVVTAL